MKFWVLCWTSLDGKGIPCDGNGLIQTHWDTDVDYVALYFDKKEADKVHKKYKNGYTLEEFDVEIP